MDALKPLYLLLFSTLYGCGHEVIVEKPIPYEIVIHERVQIPADLVVTEAPKSIPEMLSYGQALELWSEDRAALETVNGRLRAIRELE